MEEKQIVKSVRLGRTTDETTNRPLLVSFINEQDVVELNQNPPKLKDATTAIRSLRISPDKFHKEREEKRKMANKAKNLNDQETGNFMHLVHGMQIIKVKRKTESQASCFSGTP